MSSKDYKICLIGKFGSGKSTFVQKFETAKKNKSKIAALKAELYPLEVFTSAGTVKLNIYDTTLHAKGGLPDQGYFRTSDAAIAFFDLTDLDSYKALEEWTTAFENATRRSGSAAIPILVVGAKLDGSRELEPKDIEFPRKKGLTYMEISAKANYGVEEVLLSLLKTLLGDGTQLTEKPTISAGSGSVDAAQAEKWMKEYQDN